MNFNIINNSITLTSEAKITLKTTTKLIETQTMGLLWRKDKYLALGVVCLKYKVGTK